MTEKQFVEKHSGLWKQVEADAGKLKRLRRGPEREATAVSFLSAYREAGADLAYANTHYPGSRTARYLNDLMGKCHGLLYEKQGFTPKQAWRYFWRGFPTAVSIEGRLVVAATLTFLVGFLFTMMMTALDESFAVYFLSPEIIEAIKSVPAGPKEWAYPLMSAYIMTNNIMVSLKAFVFGLFFGLGTIYVLFYNGAMLGALTLLVYRYGDPWQYWALILPHGVWELFAIFVSGGAGLILARGILKPGSYLRRHAVVREAKNAVALLGGVVVLLVMAGLVEGFITPLDMPLAISYSVSGAAVIFLVFLMWGNKP